MHLLEYLLKFSIWITATFLFYQLFLSQLTFHLWKRYYLLGYSILAFFVPFFDISFLLPNGVDGSLHSVVGMPPIQEYIQVENSNTTILALGAIGFFTGAVVVLGRLFIQYLSFSKIRRSSALLHREGAIRIFESSEASGAFSFGNDIIVNFSNHNDEEVRRIMLHEIVHVKQRHTIDLMIAEAVCIVNWFNPFAWKLRRSIRQNLEFIADENVLSGGVNKKEYQLLLLKVTGIPCFRVATHFNISDLKKRIVMMNKMRSAKLHLTRFLFAIPLLAIILLVFRSESVGNVQYADAFIMDTVPQKVEKSFSNEENSDVKSPDQYNEKGYSLSVVMTSGEQLVLIRERDSKGVVAMTMTEWNRNKRQNEKKYGKLPPPPAPPAPPAVPAVPPVPASDAVPPRPGRVAPAQPEAPQAPEAPKAPRKTNEDFVEVNEDVRMQIEKDLVVIQHKQIELKAAQVEIVEHQSELQSVQQKLQASALELQEQQKEIQRSQRNHKFKKDRR